MIALDYRGRGQSEFATNWQSYQLPIEMADTISLMDHLAIERAFFIGSSRGGLIAMMMSATLKHRMLGAVLNDVGPVIEPVGLARIAGYVGKPIAADNWPEAATALKDANTGFRLTNLEWMEFAKTILTDRDGAPVLDYDPNLARTLPDRHAILSTPLPNMWQMFECLADLPIAVVRGANSDLLSASTLEQMQSRCADARTVTIPDRGHTPFLTEPAAIEAIRQTIARARLAIQNNH